MDARQYLDNRIRLGVALILVETTLAHVVEEDGLPDKLGDLDVAQRLIRESFDVVERYSPAFRPSLDRDALLGLASYIAGVGENFYDLLESLEHGSDQDGLYYNPNTEKGRERIRNTFSGFLRNVRYPEA